MYDKERGLYIAHCANGTLSITGKMAAVPEPVLLSANAKKFQLMQFFRTWRFLACMLRLF